MPTTTGTVRSYLVERWQVSQEPYAMERVTIVGKIEARTMRDALVQVAPMFTDGDMVRVSVLSVDLTAHRDTSQVSGWRTVL